MQAHGGEPIIPFSASFENKINDMPDGGSRVWADSARVGAPSKPILFAPARLCPPLLVLLGLCRLHVFGPGCHAP